MPHKEFDWSWEEGEMRAKEKALEAYKHYVYKSIKVAPKGSTIIHNEFACSEAIDIAIRETKKEMREKIKTIKSKLESMGSVGGKGGNSYIYLGKSRNKTSKRWEGFWKKELEGGGK